AAAGNAAVARWIGGASLATVARDPVGAVATGDLLPPPLRVIWGSDPFVLTLARAPAGDALLVTLRYEGPHPFEGNGPTPNTWTASLGIGTKALSARVRSQGETSVLLDLYGDASSFLRIRDTPEVDTNLGAPGRRHGLSATLSQGGGLASSARVRDPAA